MPNTDDLYAVVLDEGGVMHGDCAEKKWPDGLSNNVTPVLYGDSWRGEVAGLCVECNLFVDPSAS